jgi:hypothetical protein
VRVRGKYNARSRHTKVLAYTPSEEGLFERSGVVVSSFTRTRGERC